MSFRIRCRIRTQCVFVLRHSCGDLGPGRQPCGGGDCLVLSDSFLSFSANKKSTRRDSNPRPSPWQGDTPPLSHSCISSFILFFAYLQNHILNFRNLLKQPFWIFSSFRSENDLRTKLVASLCSLLAKVSGQALDRLVTVSSGHCCPSTSALSTSSSSRGLTSFE